MMKGKAHSSSGICNATVHTTKLSMVINSFNLFPLRTKKSIVYLN